MILQIYADYNKRPGVYKITYVLQHDHSVHINVGRVYRMMKTLEPPRISTDKPHLRSKHSNHSDCINRLHQSFYQKASNLAWTNDFKYIKVNGIVFVLSCTYFLTESFLAYL